MSSHIPRRNFLSSSGLALAAFATAEGRQTGSQSPNSTPPGERIRFGIIGVGMEGSGLLENAITLPGIECVGAADLYDGRHTFAKQITGNPDLFTTRNYHDLLNRKDIDCILAAVPDFWHMQVVVDACKAGKDIYCEKPMSHTGCRGIQDD